MPRPPLDEEIVRKVEDTWAKDTKQTAKDVYWTVTVEIGNVVSLRKVQDIIRSVKKRGGGQWTPTMWGPWLDDSETPEETAYILKMNRHWLNGQKRFIQKHEALWCKRLRVILEGAKEGAQLSLITLFAHREAIGRNAGREPLNIDLWAFLSFRPWLSPTLMSEYLSAIQTGLAPPPYFEMAPLNAGTPPEGEYVISIDALLMYLAVPFDEHEWRRISMASRASLDAEQVKGGGEFTTLTMDERLFILEAIYGPNEDNEALASKVMQTQWQYLKPILEGTDERQHQAQK